MKKHTIIIISLLTIGFGFMQHATAQTGNFGSGYFQNQYLFNPAMIGVNPTELNINASYKRESTSINNGPRTMYLTADYAFSNFAGLGVNVISDKIGSLSTTKFMGSYAYQVQLNSTGQKLHFGLSAGGVIERFNANEIIGDPTDVQLYNYNDRGTQFEADFGAAYVSNSLKIQASVPNLVSTLGKKERTVLNQANLFAAMAYKFKLTGSGEEDVINLEPKVAYRNYKGLKNIIDAGANIDFLENTINLYGIYHSSKNVTAGFGIKLLDAIQLNASYTTNSTSTNTISVGNAWEVGLRFYTKKK